MKSPNNLFLIEIDFCSAVIIQGLVLIKFIFANFFNGACLSMILESFGKMYGGNLLQNNWERTLHNWILTNPVQK